MDLSRLNPQEILYNHLVPETDLPILDPVKLNPCGDVISKIQAAALGILSEDSDSSGASSSRIPRCPLCQKEVQNYSDLPELKKSIDSAVKTVYGNEAEISIRAQLETYFNDSNFAIDTHDIPEEDCSEDSSSAPAADASTKRQADFEEAIFDFDHAFPFSRDSEKLAKKLQQEAMHLPDGSLLKTAIKKNANMQKHVKSLRPLIIFVLVMITVCYLKVLRD